MNLRTLIVPRRNRQDGMTLLAGSRNGFTYVTVLAVITVMGISLGATGKYWSTVSLRDKEEELLFRGDQYRNAIERYYTAIPGRHEYPSSIENLLTDNRTAAGKRHLRQQYKDPMTNEDFILITNLTTKRIIGVRSNSDKKPLKEDNFPEAYQDFKGKEKYSEWVFMHAAPGTQPSQPGRSAAPTPSQGQK